MPLKSDQDGLAASRSRCEAGKDVSERLMRVAHCNRIASQGLHATEKATVIVRFVYYAAHILLRSNFDLSWCHGRIQLGKSWANPPAHALLPPQQLQDFVVHQVDDIGNCEVATPAHGSPGRWVDAAAGWHAMAALEVDYCADRKWSELSIWR
jgi:hypothetical protein